MRKSWTLAGLALLTVPVLALGGDETARLRERLAETVRSLAELTGLRQRVAARDMAAVDELLARSEAGPGDELQAELELANLRSRVGALQEILDARSVANGEPLPPSRPADTSPGAPQSADPATVPGETGTQPTTTSTALKIAFESEGFVADRSRLGRACWRGGRYLEGVAALEPLAGDPRADYWRARCLERLSRNAEALALYRQVVELSAASQEGRSAREDLEFLEWSIAHGLADER